MIGYAHLARSKPSACAGKAHEAVSALQEGRHQRAPDKPQGHDHGQLPLHLRLLGRALPFDLAREPAKDGVHLLLQHVLDPLCIMHQRDGVGCAPAAQVQLYVLVDVERRRRSHEVLAARHGIPLPPVPVRQFALDDEVLARRRHGLEEVEAAATLDAELAEQP